MNKQQEPRLRFQGFTGVWEEKVLGEVTEYLSDGTHFSPKSQNGEYKYITSKNIRNSGLDLSDVSYISAEEHQEIYKRCSVKFGDLLLTKDGASTGNCCINFLDEEFSLLSSVAVLRPKQKKHDANFLCQVLQSPIGQNEIKGSMAGQAITRITLEKLRAYKFNFPLYEEQTHLGLFFRRLDSQIAESRAVLEKSRQLKKAMLAKMFPANGEKLPKIRFKGFEGEWECRKLGDLMNVTSVKRIHQSDWTNEGVRFLRARDIVAFNKGEKIEEPLFISKGKYNEYSEISGKVKIGDLLVTGVGTIGVPYLIEDEDPLYFKDGNVIWFQNENKIGGLFFYYSFLNNFIQDFIIETAGIGTVGTYTIDTGKKTPIFLPPTKSEQTAIGNFFRQLDETIALQAAEVEKLNQLKKGLLAAMLV